jgi:hypothetical protein
VKRDHWLALHHRNSWHRREDKRTLEQVVERAFEAGIACVLDDETEADGADESSEDVELAHRLLLPLIEHSAAGELIERMIGVYSVIRSAPWPPARHRGRSLAHAPG